MHLNTLSDHTSFIVSKLPFAVAHVFTQVNAQALWTVVDRSTSLPHKLHLLEALVLVANPQFLTMAA